jgi:predicted lipoprotein with Yx(FWY)xxD motif
MPGLRTISAFVLSVLFVAGCSVSGGSPGTSAGAGAATVGSATAPSLGTFLTGANGKTLYTYSGDAPNSSTCTGDCATAWPPFTVPAGGQPTAGAGVTGTLGTLTRADGTTQVSYNGLPLYYWQGDATAGDATGDGVNGFAVARVGGTVAAPSAGSSAGASAGPTKPGY